MYELFIYETSEHEFPFEIWLNDVRDLKTQAIIRAKLDRLRLGLFGNTKSVSSGVFELKVDYGPGYRIYFGLAGQLVILLLWGGSKKTQASDIERASTYWQNYKREMK